MARHPRKRPERIRREAPKALSLMVFCEGEKTEPSYFKKLGQKYRARVTIEVDRRTGLDPLSLVENASEVRARDQKAARKNGGLPVDEYWCVFDRDDHNKFHEAVDLAEKNGIEVAASVPCVELWFILHIRDHTAHIDRSEIQKEFVREFKCNKTVSNEAFETLEDLFETARTRAIALDDRHEKNGSPRFSNPSSGLWTPVEKIRTA